MSLGGTGDYYKVVAFSLSSSENFNVSGTRKDFVDDPNSTSYQPHDLRQIPKTSVTHFLYLSNQTTNWSSLIKLPWGLSKRMHDKYLVQSLAHTGTGQMGVIHPNPA